MKTGFRGTFVISWSQTEIDGLEDAPVGALDVGAAWSWRGDTVRVDGPNGLLRLDGADGEAEIRKRAARTVRRLVGAVVRNITDLSAVEVDDPLMERYFVVTDGARSYTITVIESGPGRPPLLMFLDMMPPRHTDLWVVRHTLSGQMPRPVVDTRGGVICFTPGTRLETPKGLRRVEDLREGEHVLTRDNGAQPVMWVGSRRISGARLQVMPHLRPVRLRPGALGIERPDQELLVSPDHRMLVRGRAAHALFNTDEVLVAARDLVNGTTVIEDHAVREVTYVHLLLPTHEILVANGVETESFHPANADLGTLGPQDRARLLGHQPGLEDDPHRYGPFARRNLSQSEAAILMHEAA
ncbi:Hint domain-containing protein [Antarcticimicrobium sediminis]|uniref:Hint domain-containing protein n=1 Tax=Antarcticimicrobium sediminis TaxID=2546227 RepID=A0A4R5EPF2_9RHOB|nr:Hint domain-containing protein [Antarcticimicrobium sediminis]TDE36619.1 Hint domain-containing protein [Antarcticimicrobium sediminis]